MICPACEHTVIHTYDSRKLGGGVLRKRKCLSCDFRFYTFEALMSEDEFEELQQRIQHDARSQSQTKCKEDA